MVLLCGGLVVAICWDAVWRRQAVDCWTEDGVYDSIGGFKDVPGASGHPKEAALHMPAIRAAESRHLVAGAADQVLGCQGMEVPCEPVLVHRSAEVGARFDPHRGHQVDGLDQVAVGHAEQRVPVPHV